MRILLIVLLVFGGCSMRTTKSVEQCQNQCGVVAKSCVEVPVPSERAECLKALAACNASCTGDYPGSQ